MTMITNRNFAHGIAEQCNACLTKFTTIKIFFSPSERRATLPNPASLSPSSLPIHFPTYRSILPFSNIWVVHFVPPLLFPPYPNLSLFSPPLGLSFLPPPSSHFLHWCAKLIVSPIVSMELFWLILYQCQGQPKGENLFSQPLPYQLWASVVLTQVLTLSSNLPPHSRRARLITLPFLASQE